MFYIKDEKLFNKKLDSIKKDQRKISGERSRAGKISAEKRKAKRLTTSTNVEQMLNSVATKPQQKATNTVQNSTEQKSKDKTIIKDFEIFWADYPRKIGKAKAKTAYESARKKTSHDDIIRGMFISPRLKGDDPQFIPHAATWLNQESWNDEEEIDPKAFPQPHMRRVENGGIVVYHDKEAGKVYDEHGKISDKVEVFKGVLSFS
jgi:hypothetical protein